ncbi:MAG TPA: tetratricopeptide repeat protein [Ktedonobacteraceae bacterium]
MPHACGPVDVFYCYAHQDEHLRQGLDAHLSLLQRQGLISAWHERRVRAGMDWADEIDAHLETASLIVLLISPAFLASGYCSGSEMRYALERERTRDARVIPILLRPVAWRGAPFAHLPVLPTGARALTSWKNRDEGFVDIAAGIRRALTDRWLQQFSASQTILWNVPQPPKPCFLGREDLLTQLHTQLQLHDSTAPSQRQAISGLGGVGKTQIAVEYAYRYRESYQQVLWVRAENSETLNSSYCELAALLQLSEQHVGDQEVLIEAVKRWLQTQKGWLLICDNADEPELLAPFLPPTLGGQLLLTSRSRTLSRLGIAQPLLVDAFAPEQGALLLLRRAGLLAPDADLAQASPANRQAAQQISQELGGLPLALDQAGAYLEVTGRSLSAYQRLYQQRRAVQLGQRRGPAKDHPEPVAITCSLLFARVAEESPAAVEILRLCAFVAAAAIPSELFTEGASALGPLLAPLANDPLAFEGMIETLRAYALVERDAANETLTVHRLIQASVRDSLVPEIQHTWLGRAAQALFVTFPDIGAATWPACERLLPHALQCIQWLDHARIASLGAARLLNETAYYLDERARFRESEPLWRQALEIRERILGVEHSATVLSLNNLGLSYSEQGRYAEAEPLWRQALEIRERVLGAEHPETVNSLNNLAIIYDTQGRYAEAEPLYKRVLKISGRVLGTEHPDTAGSLANLGVLYKKQERYEEAELLARRALEIRERVLGAEHPETADSLGSLSVLYGEQGRYAEAEPLALRALEINQRVLGAEHPETATSLNNLGYLYDEQGRYGDAEPLLLRALEIRERVLGAEHPSTASSLNSLGILCKRQGRYEQAEVLMLRALEIRERVLGAEHPETVMNLSNLGYLYNEQGRYEEAELLYRRALAIRERVLGVEHPDTARSLSGLGMLYYDQGRYEEAEPLVRRALEIEERVLSSEHPETADSLNNLSLVYREQGRYEEAEPLVRRALEINQQVLGAEHPDTAWSLRYLSVLYKKQERYEEAEPLARRALEINQRVLGVEHRGTRLSQDNYQEIVLHLQAGEQGADNA